MNVLRTNLEDVLEVYRDVRQFALEQDHDLVLVRELNVHRMMRYSRSCYAHPPDLHRYSAVGGAAIVIVIVERIFANSEMRGLVLLCMLILQSLPVGRRIVSSVLPL